MFLLSIHYEMYISILVWNLQFYNLQLQFTILDVEIYKFILRIRIYLVIITIVSACKL